MIQGIILCYTVLILFPTSTSLTSTSYSMFSFSGFSIAETKHLSIQTSNLDEKDEGGFSPLIHAIRDQQYNDLEELLRQGAGINVKDAYGWTPLMHAISKGNPSVVRFLLAHGANVNLKDNRGMTALMWGALAGKSEIVDLLISKGADINSTAESGATALTFAEGRKHSDVARLLKQAGGMGPLLDSSLFPKNVWGPVDTMPKLLNLPMPSYTDEARQKGVEGIVYLRMLLEANGKIKQTRVIRGLPAGLSDQAVKAASKLRFRPAMNNGQPISYWVNVQVEFRLSVRAGF